MILDWQFFSFSEQKYCATSCWPPWFLIWNLLSFELFPPYRSSVSLTAFKIFSLFLIFRTLTMICLVVDFYGFIFWIFSASWICRIRYFAKFEEFSAIISLSNSTSCFFSSHSGLLGTNARSFVIARVGDRITCAFLSEEQKITCRHWRHKHRVRKLN